MKEPHQLTDLARKFADANNISRYATELVTLAPDVIRQCQHVVALQRATTSVPIVFAAVTDPVAAMSAAALPRAYHSDNVQLERAASTRSSSVGNLGPRPPCRGSFRLASTTKKQRALGTQRCISLGGLRWFPHTSGVKEDRSPIRQRVREDAGFSGRRRPASRILNLHVYNGGR